MGGGEERAYEVWVGFIVDAAFGWGEANFEGERSVPDDVLEDGGGCHFWLCGGGRLYGLVEGAGRDWHERSSMGWL